MKRASLALGAVVAVALLSGAISESVLRQRARRDFPAPGRLVDVGGGRRLQLDCRGTGSPTVVLESGLDNYGSLAWGPVHDSIAQTTRVCAYSRPGIMWSDPTSGPFDATALARDLHAALTTSGEATPWVMVGHSLGGPYVMAFTREYDSEVAGMVLVDPSHPDQFPLFRQVTGKGMEPDPTEVRVGALLAWTGVLRLLLPEDAPGGAVQVSRAAPAFLPMSLGELARETSAIPLLLSQTGEFRSLGDRPLIVLTATLPHTAAVRQIMGVTPAQDSALLAISRRLHEDQAHWSTRGEHVLVERASHYIQFDRPDAVVAAVRSVVQRSR